MMPMQFCWKLFFAGKFKGKQKTGHQGRKGRKGNDQGKRVGLFLGYCDQMDLLRQKGGSVESATVFKKDIEEY